MDNEQGGPRLPIDVEDMPTTKCDMCGAIIHWTDDWTIVPAPDTRYDENGPLEEWALCSHCKGQWQAWSTHKE